MKRRATRLSDPGEKAVTKQTARTPHPRPFGKGEERGESLAGSLPLTLSISNRQRTRSLDTRGLRQIIRSLLHDQLQLQAYELGITLVAALEMTRLNKSYLHHSGSTDVITFDHSELGTGHRAPGTKIHGELFICIDEAILQSRRFRTTWQSELIRYVIHGVLHLLGHDDHRVADRRKMKLEENLLLRSLAKQINFRVVLGAAKS